VSAFDALDGSLIETFGEVALGNPIPVFYPDTGYEEEVDGILSQSARAEEVVPGVVARLFVKRDGLSQQPERRDTVEVRGVLYSIEDMRGDDIGGVEILLRKK